MTPLDILRLRLQNQHLAGRHLNQPADVVKWLGAVQAQDYTGAKWALAQRVQNATSLDIDKIFAEGKILRTHIMRPTWHFVAPQDIRWIMELTAPRVKAAMAYNNRLLTLDDAVFDKTNQIIKQALHGRQLTRNELAEVLRQAGIDLSANGNLRLAHIVMRAELDLVICSGALRGKQHTYALLDERAPVGKTLNRQQALAELARRYFTSHGPATVKDYAWWSGLTMTDAKAGLQTIGTSMTSQVVDGQEYWHDATLPDLTNDISSVYLPPNYDEYVVAYTDRSMLFDTKHTPKLDARQNPLFNHAIIADGQIVGTWRPVTTRKIVTVETNLFSTLKKTDAQKLTKAIQLYKKFVDLPHNK